MTNLFRNKRSDIFFLILILLLSMVFRLTNLDLIEFKSDEAANLLLSSRQIFGLPIPPGGTGSSVGVLNPPLFNYLLIPLTYFTLDPQSIVFFIGVLNIIAIVSFFFIVKKYYSSPIAFISSTLIALSPWAILFSRKIWMQDLLIPFFIPLFLSIHKLVIEKKEGYWVLYTSTALFLIQLHQASIFFLAPLSFFLILKKIKINYKYILIGIVIGIIPLLPFVAYEASHNCPDCKSILMSSRKLGSLRSLEIFQRPLQILGQGNFDFIFGTESFKLFYEENRIVFELRKILYLFYFIIPLSLFMFVKIHKKFSFFVYSLIFTSAIYYFLKIEPRMHYFILFIPILALSTGIIFDYALHKGKIFKITSIVLFITISSVLILYNLTFFNFLRKHNGASGDYGAIYAHTSREANSKLQEFKNRKDYREIFLSNYIPLGYMFGFMPLSQMLYPNVVSKKEFALLEERLANKNADPRINQKLIAFFTQIEPDIKVIKQLKQKKELIPEYETVYKEVLSYYVSRNFLKNYRSEKYDFEFYYPEHWKIKEDESINLSGDGYQIKISKLLQSDSKPESKYVFDLIDLDKTNFLVEIIPQEKNRASNENIRKTTKKIIDSIMF